MFGQPVNPIRWPVSVANLGSHAYSGNGKDRKQQFMQ